MYRRLWLHGALLHSINAVTPVAAIEPEAGLTGAGASVPVISLLT